MAMKTKTERPPRGLLAALVRLAEAGGTDNCGVIQNDGRTTGGEMKAATCCARP